MTVTDCLVTDCLVTTKRTCVAAQQFTCRGFFATLGAVVVPPFRAIATLDFTRRDHALTCTVAAAVVFRTWLGSCTNTNRLPK